MVVMLMEISMLAVTRINLLYRYGRWSAKCRVQNAEWLVLLFALYQSRNRPLVDSAVTFSNKNEEKIIRGYDMENIQEYQSLI